MRIGSTAVADLKAQNNLGAAMSRLNEGLLRLSTLQRVNRAADDPAAMIGIAEIESELTVLEKLDTSLGRTVGSLNVADSALGQTGDLLASIRGNLVEAADGNLSDTQRAAKQVEIDQALAAIDRIGTNTSVFGRKLLDPGNEAARTLNVPLSADLSRSATLVLPGVGTSALGGPEGLLSDLSSGGSADLRSGNLAQAMKIVDAAQRQVLEGRAQAGAFQRYTIESSQATLDATELHLSDSLSRLRDADVAVETSRLVGAKIAVQAAMGSLKFGYESRTAFAKMLATMRLRSWY